MAVSVSRDLSVSVTADVNTDKLLDTQQALRSNVRKGEPRSLGVSQLMLGLLVMTYSLPLYFAEPTTVVKTGVPWWSGLSFMAAGIVAIIMEKQCCMKTLMACLVVTAGAVLLSLVALVLYSLDLSQTPSVECNRGPYGRCSNLYNTVTLGHGIKSCLLFFTLVQAIISSTLWFLLYRERRAFAQYASLSHRGPSESISHLSPELN